MQWKEYVILKEKNLFSITEKWQNVVSLLRLHATEKHLKCHIDKNIRQGLPEKVRSWKKCDTKQQKTSKNAGTFLPTKQNVSTDFFCLWISWKKSTEVPLYSSSFYMFLWDPILAVFAV